MNMYLWCNLMLYRDCGAKIFCCAAKVWSLGNIEFRKEKLEIYYNEEGNTTWHYWNKMKINSQQSLLSSHWQKEEVGLHRLSCIWFMSTKQNVTSNETCLFTKWALSQKSDVILKEPKASPQEMVVILKESKASDVILKWQKSSHKNQL